MTTPEYRGQQQLQSNATPYSTRRFEILQLIGKMCTVEPVIVISCTSAGELAEAGRVVVRPLTNQVAGDGTSMPHADIYDVPYVRMQGGNTAFIIDPVAGDIGLALFARSDISAVKAARGAANPGSFRRFDWADAVYLGGLLNAQPTQYVRASDDGLEFVSPTKVRIQAPAIEVVGPVSQSGGDVTVATKLTASTDVVGGGISLKTHTHSGVQTGGGTSGPPVP